MTVIAAFDPRFTVTNAVTGGVDSVDRAVLLGAGEAQKSAAQRVQEIFSGRIGDARAALNAAGSGPTIDALTHQQSLLASRKARVNKALSVLNAADTQIQFIKSNISFLRQQVDAFQAGDISEAEIIDYWDNTLRTINNNSRDASKLFRDGSVYFQKNLISSQSRVTFATQTLLAPTNSRGDTIEISGIFLGSDYFITEDGTGDVFLSTAGFRNSATAPSELIEYTSYPDTLSGISADTSTITVNSFDTVTGAIQFTSDDTGTVDGTVTRGGLGLLDSFLYQSAGPGTFDAQTAEVDLDAAEATVLNAQADFNLVRQTLVGRVDFFDAQIDALAREITARIRDIRDDKEADLLSVELEFTIAQFDFAILAARGNTLIRSLINAQDNQGEHEFDTTRSGELVVGSIVDVQA